MQVEVNEIGHSRSRVLVIDDFMPNPAAVIDAVAQLGPFPPEGETAYPGLRRQIVPTDAAASYVMATLQALKPVIQRGFGADAFAVTEASFSLVTTRPEALTPVQRVPHIDNDDQSLLAILHHLHELPGTGTAFYRHKPTGLERADPSTSALLRSQLREDGVRLNASGRGFAGDSNEIYDKIFAVEGRFNRLVIYQGCLLHSGIIPPDFAYSPDPRRGRLTGNIFVRMQGTGSGNARP